MTGNQLMDRMWRELEKRGYQGRMVSHRHIRDLEEALQALHREGNFSDEFYEERLTSFSFAPPETMPGVQSIIIIAVPRPQTAAVFNWHGESLSLIIPPTYTDYRKVPRQAADLLNGILDPFGYGVAYTNLPLKLLAVRSGLGAYGRNNICYVPGMGSFLELVGLYSDLSCRNDQWQEESRMMDACRNCRACLHHCPSHAITGERFLLDADRCIVLHGERPGSIPFPSWIDPSWHNCLEGCMRCQRICPENRDFVGWIEGTEEFSEEETALLLKGVPPDQLPAETIGKLERLDLLGDYEVIPRNLGVFLNS